MNGQPVPGAVSPVHIEPVYYDEAPKERQAGKCCGCCCDFRRAVIIINGLLCVGSIISLITEIVIKPEDNLQYHGVDDDAVLQELDQTKTPMIILAALGILFHPIPLWGALKYEVRAVAFGCVWFVSQFVATSVIEFIAVSNASDVAKEGESLGSPIPSMIGSLVGTSLYVYAHAMLVREIKQGIMTEATYEREKYSCCCV